LYGVSHFAIQANQYAVISLKKDGELGRGLEALL
jgi:hypothetical protein